MEVLIMKITTGNLIAKFHIVLGGLNYFPSDQEYFDEAWRCAVEDNLVIQDRRTDYSFKLGS